MNEYNTVKQSPLAGLAAYGGGSGSLLFGRKGVDGYQIKRSLRFNDSDTAFLGRTPSSVSSGNTKLTYSVWVKSANITDKTPILSASSTGGSESIEHRNDGSLVVFFDEFVDGAYITSKVFRDPAAWYHYIFSIDTTLSTAADRVKIYVNGAQVSTTTSPALAQNFSFTGFNQQNKIQYIGRTANTSGGQHHYASAYYADIHMIDGQALGPNNFGEYDANNVWQPKEYEGTYGTNGFHLDFSDNTNTTTIAEDSSGNNNDFSSSNISVASGSGNDSLIDSPTDYDAGSGNNGGNYCVFNPLRDDQSGYSEAPTNGNLDTYPRGDFPGTIPVTSGKYYWEITITTVTSSGQAYMGVLDVEQLQKSGSRSWSTSQIAAMRDNGSLYGNGSTGSGVTYAQGDILGFALDASTGKLWIAKNNTWINSGNPAGGTGHAFSGLSYSAYTLIASDSNTGNTYSLNAGQRPFSYTPPTGFLSICTTNLPDPTIADGSDYFDVKTYTGNDNTQTITGMSLQPDLLWLKSRAQATNHELVDSVRGSSKYLFSNLNNATITDTARVTSFNSDGFAIGANSNANVSGGAVAWAWNAGANSDKTYTVKVVSDSGNKYRFDDFGTSAVTLSLAEGSTYVFDQSDASNSGHPLRFSTTSNGTHGGGSEYTTGVTVTGTPGQAGAKTTIVVAASAPTLYYYCSVHSGMGGQANTNSTAGASNFNGSIQATVKANQTAGFSIVSYSGNGTNGATVGHGLNSKPDLILLKSRGLTENWFVYHSALGATKATFLSTTDSANANSVYFNNTEPTSSVFSLGTRAGINQNTDLMIAYCFSAVEGYSAFGSYTGNGSADGPFVYTGFRPRFLLIKEASTNGNGWVMIDSERDPHNVIGNILFANDSSNEETSSSKQLDLVSNGFKLKASGHGINVNSNTYVYAAFAEHPFKTVRAR